ncbi:MAG: thiamine pyrophosphate-binding protein [Terriglobia bacterium]
MSNTAGDILVETMLAWGIDTIFGIPRGRLNGIIEALRIQQDKIRFTQVRHEEAAAFMAWAPAKSPEAVHGCLRLQRARHQEASQLLKEASQLLNAGSTIPRSFMKAIAGERIPGT